MEFYRRLFSASLEFSDEVPKQLREQREYRESREGGKTSEPIGLRNEPIGEGSKSKSGKEEGVGKEPMGYK